MDPPPAWPDYADKFASIVGAVAGVVGLLRDMRAQPSPAASSPDDDRGGQENRFWQRIAGGLFCLVLIILAARRRACRPARAPATAARGNPPVGRAAVGGRATADTYVEQQAEHRPMAGRDGRIFLREMPHNSHDTVVIAELGVGRSTAIAHIAQEQCRWWQEALLWNL